MFQKDISIDPNQSKITKIMNFNELPIENKLKNSIKFADFKILISERKPVINIKKTIILKFISLFGIKINNDNSIKIPPENGGLLFLSIKVLCNELFLLSNKKLVFLIK